MQKKKKKKLRILNIFMDDCCCYQCGPGHEEVIEKEQGGLDPITKEPVYHYYKYDWYTPYDEEDWLEYENVAETLDGVLYVNNGDYEETTQKEYEEYLSYWHNKISEHYLEQRESEKELRRKLIKMQITIPRLIDLLREEEKQRELARA